MRPFDPSRRGPFRLTLTGVGAMRSPRYAPAGLLLEYGTTRVMFDGGPGSEPSSGSLSAWLLTDERAELVREIRTRATRFAVAPRIDALERAGLAVTPHPVVHTSHATCGYLIEAEGRRIAWAPEFLEFPEWANGVDLLFADAAAWDRQIRFAHGAGGHAAALATAEAARAGGVVRLVLAHIGRPTIRALDAGLRPPFGVPGRDGQRFYPRRWRAVNRGGARAPLRR
jgi:hypothetical protein